MRKYLLINSVAVALSIFILARWFILIDKYSVNMLFLDQWDFMGGLFEQKGPWELFSWQHGPHRQGVGFFLTKLTADLSGWNTRIECFMIGTVICLAALTALALKWRLAGNITAFDLVIPLLYLSPLQFELFANTPNVSHGAMPLLLITLFALCWMIQNIPLRYTLCAAINFMTLYTGFGIFIGCVTPLLFLSEFALAVKNNDSRRKRLAVVFFFISVASIASFFLNYTFNSALEGFVFPHPHSFIYVKFILIAFATFIGMRMSNIVLYFIAAPIIFYMLYVIFRSGKDIATSVDDKEVPRNQIIIVLIIFTLIFSLNLAIGRACLGLGAAAASRYIPYMTPGFFALYLFTVTREKMPERVLLVCIALFFITTISIGTSNTKYSTWLCEGKERWKQAYLKTENVERSTQLSGFIIHPKPHDTKLGWKLDYLKKNRLNLYLDAPRQ
ncbi:MAG: hypothetical protein CDV28_101164 [Candidatus Electronema aureum]|uniref:Glucosyl transferase GtrII n=1 Tax=Candidatus Electronema aureum TaxID=2005002 RepID=A0A521G5F9_9BACT|nr:MAG: hypothetical protein CDV28_101164 [Candidatus Electronema aureum]